MGRSFSGQKTWGSIILANPGCLKMGKTMRIKICLYGLCSVIDLTPNFGGRWKDKSGSFSTLGFGIRLHYCQGVFGLLLHEMMYRQFIGFCSGA